MSYLKKRLLFSYLSKSTNSILFAILLALLQRLLYRANTKIKPLTFILSAFLCTKISTSNVTYYTYDTCILI